MVFIKKLVMHGFKSFAKKTEIVFDKGINVILGPNGSGKSNISDALCFVLGRLSIKSMRAAKAKNLLFMGSKYHKPAREAVVELVFDNTNRVFALESDEVTIKRVVRYTGQGIYKINGETKTRLEVIEMLAQAGIDPYGFNLILQGQIQSIVKMHPEDRRKIIEEVAGIAIYESRKERSLKELEKTEERLKEINAILRERTAYLKNLDKERSQALRFKEIELMIKRLKASLLGKRAHEKQKELETLQKSIEEKQSQRDEFKQQTLIAQEEIERLAETIEQITKHIQQATGLEQETLHSSIANLRAELEGLKVRKENYENRKAEVERRIAEMQRSIPNLELEIQELKHESPLLAQKAQELKKKKEELAALEEEKRSSHAHKAELQNVREKMKDKERQLGRVQAESESLVKQLEEYASGLQYKHEEECEKVVHQIHKELTEKRKELESIAHALVGHEKALSVAEVEISQATKISEQVSTLDICPICQSTIDEVHVHKVHEAQHSLIEHAKKQVEQAQAGLVEKSTQRKRLIEAIKALEIKSSQIEVEKIRHTMLKERHEALKRRVEEEKTLKHELRELEERRKIVEEKTSQTYSLEEKYDSVLLEIEEISSRTSENIDTSLLYKERELERIHGAIKINTKDLKELAGTIRDLQENRGIKLKSLESKETQEQELQKKFKKLFDQRETTQHTIQEKNLALSELTTQLRSLEDQINYLKIGKAKLDAEKEAVDMELADYAGLELVSGSVQALEEKLQKNQQASQEIGNINLRALEVYDEVKKEYDVVFEKVQTLEREKQEIMLIITEIDMKKKRSFMKTFKALSGLFSRNFAKLYTKGVAFLELENKDDLFAGGVNIIVRLAKGKYFDVTSLSGGEQTLVALSLLFAIQEYKPYHFYVFDEIDAALDKRNSERLAALLNQYMQSGQYLVITHNDAIIVNAEVLYGISMHEGVSKILSLQIKEVPEALKEPVPATTSQTPDKPDETES